MIKLTSVRYSVRNSVWNSVRDSVGASLWDSVWDFSVLYRVTKAQIVFSLFTRSEV